MQYRKFGRTNEMVSVLGFGCMRLPILPGGDTAQIDEEAATRLIRYAIDNGVNYIDTAYPYHGKVFGQKGVCEPFLNRVLRDGYREKVKLATKLPSWMVKSREDMDRLLNDQLQRLDSGPIDFYLVHGITSATWPVLKEAGFERFLDDAIKDGKIKYAGFSFHDKLDLFKEIVDAYDWSFCLIQYNYMDENYQAGTEGLQYANKKGLGVAVMEPLRGGILAGNLPDDVMEIINGVHKTPAELGLGWIWSHPEVSVVLSGMNSMEQLTENMNTADKAGVLSPEESDAVDRVRKLYRSKIKIGCTGCGYCMPCPAGVNIPISFSMYNNFHMFGRKEPYTFRLAPNQRASNCSECGRCEEHCPQGILIREELKNVCNAFEEVK